MERYNLSPNTDVIQSLLFGDYQSGELTTLYGNSSSGKTTSCFLATISAVKYGKIVYIDTEKGFNFDRLRDLGFQKSMLDKIFLIQPKSFYEQQKAILSVKELCKNPNIKLVIVDTIGNYYRIELNKDPTNINKMMVEQLRDLVRIARDLNKVVLVTNQVYSDMKSNKIKMVSGRIIEHLSKCIIELNKLDSARYASLTKYKMSTKNTTFLNLGKKIKFDITKTGLFKI